jgi:hypothetical protein
VSLFTTLTDQSWRVAIARSRAEPNLVLQQIHQSMSTINQPRMKTVKRFHVKIGDSYATLDFNLHDKGVLVRCHAASHAWVFNRNVDAGHAMERTRKLQAEVRDSMHADWYVFKPLLYDDTPTVEEYQIEVQDE